MSKTVESNAIESAALGKKLFTVVDMNSGLMKATIPRGRIEMRYMKNLKPKIFSKMMKTNVMIRTGKTNEIAFSPASVTVALPKGS
jgi:hypothetical protein